jgi:hypothetical protein
MKWWRIPRKGRIWWKIRWWRWVSMKFWMKWWRIPRRFIFFWRWILFWSFGVRIPWKLWRKFWGFIFWVRIPWRFITRGF